MSRKNIASIALGLLLTTLISCSGGADKIPEADSITTLAEALQAAGMRVNGPLQNDVLASRFFPVPGVSFQASGESVLAYEFESFEDAELSRGSVSADGYGIGPKYINWRSDPSYYANGRLIVIYEGDESLVRRTLEAAMGAPFAGDGTAPS
jgi:hypothetical protein